MFSLMSSLQTFYHFQLDFQKVAQHTRGKIIHGIKLLKDNQLSQEDSNIILCLVQHHKYKYTPKNI